jgi:hypothetical protein
MYQLPGDFELGASLLGREGYPKAIHIRTSLGADGNRRLLPPGGLDVQRHDNFWNLDLRLAKNLKLRATAALNLTVDRFNVFNADTVLNATGRSTRMRSIRSWRSPTRASCVSGCGCSSRRRFRFRSRRAAAPAAIPGSRVLAAESRDVTTTSAGKRPSAWDRRAKSPRDSRGRGPGWSRR